MSHGKCSIKMLFLKILQYSEEKTALEPLIKLEALLFSGKYCETFKNTSSEEHLQTIAVALISLF